jgi:photosystem II oxygen-evolving enhancer protein 2
MLKRLAIILLIVLNLSLSGGQPALALGGLKPYVDTKDGYQFLYPNGWIELKVDRKSGLDVVFRDLIEQTENVSMVINPLPQSKTLAELGTPSEVGYKLSKVALAPPDSGRVAELVNAEAGQKGDKTYYLLEYAVKLANGQERHNLASVGISRGKLFTLNISATEKRWSKVKSQFEEVVKSLTLY